MTTKKVGASRKSSGKTRTEAETADTPKSMPKEGKDPKGGLTAKGREYFAKKEGSHLRPGVQGPADTPEKMVRKGSFLRRHFAHPRGPVKDEKGQPTRLALSAHAWGEPVPQTMADTKKLAAKGHELLEEYHHIKDEQAGGTSRASSSTKAAQKRAAGKSVPAKSPTKRAGKTAAKTASRNSPAKAASKRSATKTPGVKRAAKAGARKG